MSNLNLRWMQENFAEKDIILFNIGCADLSDDSFRFQTALPRAKIYSFDCSDHWQEKNLRFAKDFGFNYVHKAVTDSDGIQLFYEGKDSSTQVANAYAYSGRLQNPSVMLDEVLPKNTWWNEGKPVETISLNTFCESYSLVPTMLHIDTEGEEYNILKSLDQKFWPKIIWLEHWKFYNDSDNNSVPFSVLDSLLQSWQYQQIYNNGDVMYVHQNYAVTPYTECADSLEFERTLQQKIWLQRYQRVKDRSWPDLAHPKEFYSLPLHIITECKEVFDLEPSEQIV